MTIRRTVRDGAGLLLNLGNDVWISVVIGY